MTNEIDKSGRDAAKGQSSNSEAAKRREALESLKKFRGWMPADFKFDREEAHERGSLAIEKGQNASTK